LKHYDPTSDAIYTTIDVYDRLWNNIGWERFPILKRVSRKINDTFRIPVITLPTPNGVVLCESVNPEDFDRGRLSHALRRRPSPLDLPSIQGSMLGWLPNSVGAVGRFLDPLVELNEGGLSAADAPTHGYRVAATLLSQNPDAAIIPISMPNCQKLYPLWSPIIQRYSVKVVNFSGTEPMDRRWCKEFNYPENFLGPNKPFLWIVAAGNRGVENPALRCPQTLGPLENLIVVAGGNSGGLWKSSDYGRNYADIVADVSSASSSDSGTSYSAARVSAVAARISELYAMLSPWELRLSILFGADIPATPLEVRSGGALNEKLALTIAEAISRLSVEERQSLTSSVAQRILESYFSRSETTRRLNLWKERRLIPWTSVE